MATYQNKNKTSTIFANRAKIGGNNLTWDEATYTWDESGGTWNVPDTAYTRRTKNSSTFTGRTKN